MNLKRAAFGSPFLFVGFRKVLPPRRHEVSEEGMKQISFTVILNVVKDLIDLFKILRFAQNDNNFLRNFVNLCLKTLTPLLPSSA
jgi:hypothetical protein